LSAAVVCTLFFNNAHNEVAAVFAVGLSGPFPPESSPFSMSASAQGLAGDLGRDFRGQDVFFGTSAASAL
jgi:hypothetical protein